MFCKTCENFMDITNNVAVPNLHPIDDPILQDGGKIDETSSDYEITTDISSKKKKTVILTDDDIINVLSGKDITVELDNYNISDLNKIPYFNKLTSNQKTLVINRLYEKLPKSFKMPKSTDTTITKETYFYCKYCGNNEKISDKMFIFSRSGDSSNQTTIDSKILNYKYDPTLPFSKKYNCINKDCKTHTEPVLKKAVFHRIGDTYAIRYICTVCDHYWSTATDNMYS